MSAPTIKDVARLAHVSTATVSAVINETNYVSPPLKERVLEAIAQLSYAPSGVARSLRTQATRLIGLIVADITNPFFAQFVRLVGSYAQEWGYSLLLCETDHDPAKELEALQLLAAHRVDGVILAPTGPAENYFEPPVSNFPKPLLMADRVIPYAPFDAVSIDNHRAAYDVTNYMLSLGHTRIAIIAGARHLSITGERLDGFRDAMEARNVAVDPSNIIYADFREDRAFDLTRKLLAKPNRPTAIFASNNEMLIGAMRAITDMGLSVPGDISLAAIDDFPWADAFSPRLTTARQPIRELAEHSVRLLHERMGGKRKQGSVKIVLSAELVIRDSCAALEQAV